MKLVQAFSPNSDIPHSLLIWEALSINFWQATVVHWYSSFTLVSVVSLFLPFTESMLFHLFLEIYSHKFSVDFNSLLHVQIYHQYLEKNRKDTWSKVINRGINWKWNLKVDTTDNSGTCISSSTDILPPVFKAIETRWRIWRWTRHEPEEEEPMDVINEKVRETSDISTHE